MRRADTLGAFPSLLGLSRARVELPTPHGMVVPEMEKGKEPRVTVLGGVTVERGEKG